MEPSRTPHQSPRTPRSQERENPHPPRAPLFYGLPTRLSRRIGAPSMPSPIAHASSARRHLLSCEELSAGEIKSLLDLADKAVDSNRQINKKRDVLRGRTLINLFFEASTRTQSSFELAGKRLSADVMTMNVATSSGAKREKLSSTA